MVELIPDERDPYRIYSNPDYVPPINNLVFAVGIIVLGLCAISISLFAVGSILEWGVDVAMGVLQ